MFYNTQVVWQSHAGTKVGYLAIVRAEPSPDLEPSPTCSTYIRISSLVRVRFLLPEQSFGVTHLSSPRAVQPDNIFACGNDSKKGVASISVMNQGTFIQGGILEQAIRHVGHGDTSGRDGICSRPRWYDGLMGSIEG